MSYLSTLARPSEMPIRPAVGPLAVSRAETFGEVHEEAVAGLRQAATESRIDRFDNPAPVAARDIGFTVQSPAAPVDLSSQLPTARDLLPTTEAPPARSTPVAIPPRRTPAAADAPESSIEERSAPQTPSPVARRVGDSSPVLRVDAEPAAPVPSFLRPPIAPNARPQVNVHIGAISLTVKAPAAAAPATKPVAVAMAQPLPAALPPRSREGLGFSASRHYLRWS